MGGPAPAAFSSAEQTYMCRPRGRVQVAIKGEQSNVLLFAGIAFPQRFLQVAGVARAQPLHGRSYGALKSADSLRPSTCMSCLATRSWSWWSAWSGLSTSTPRSALVCGAARRRRAATLHEAAAGAPLEGARPPRGRPRSTRRPRRARCPAY